MAATIDVVMESSPINGDILECILSHVPLVDLAPASLVSNQWKLAVSSSLLHLNPPKPFLFLHTQSTHTPYSTSTSAYEARIDAWFQIRRPSIKHVSALRVSNSGRILFMLSPSKLAFSSDPFNLTWHHAEAPFVWRADPIVALVGNKLVVAGGGCDFEDDPLAVEIYDVRNRNWDSCESMPFVLRDSAASTWLSSATDGHTLFVVERRSGVMHTFDPELKSWSGPFDLRAEDENVFCSIITYSSDLGLILIGLIGEMDGNARGVKIWSIDPERVKMEEIGEMPREIFDKGFGVFWSINACSAGNWICIYRNPYPFEVYICEVLMLKGKGKGKGGGGYCCRWKKEKIPADMVGRSPVERVVLTCSEVTINDVNRARRSNHWKCLPRHIHE